MFQFGFWISLLLGTIALIAMCFAYGNWIIGTLMLGGALWIALRVSRPQGPPRRNGKP